MIKSAIAWMCVCFLLGCSTEQPRDRRFGEVFDKDDPFHLQLPKLTAWAEEANRRVGWSGIRRFLEVEGLTVGGHEPITTNLMTGSVEWRIAEGYEARLDITFGKSGEPQCGVDIYGDVTVDLFERQFSHERFSPIDCVLRTAAYRRNKAMPRVRRSSINFYPGGKFEPPHFIIGIEFAGQDKKHWLFETREFSVRDKTDPRDHDDEATDETIGRWRIQDRGYSGKSVYNK